MSENNYILTSDGIVISMNDDELMHWKYLKREWKNGRWNYIYDKPETIKSKLSTKADALKSKLSPRVDAASRNVDNLRYDRTIANITKGKFNVVGDDGWSITKVPKTEFVEGREALRTAKMKKKLNNIGSGKLDNKYAEEISKVSHAIAKGERAVKSVKKVMSQPIKETVADLKARKEARAKEREVERRVDEACRKIDNVRYDFEALNEVSNGNFYGDGNVKELKIKKKLNNIGRGYLDNKLEDALYRIRR